MTLVEPDAASQTDAAWQRLDPRKIDLDRAVGWIVTCALSLAWLMAIGVLSLSDDLPPWIWWSVVALWVPFTVGIAVLSFQLPPLEYRYARYRIDDELIAIERGVVFRKSISVPRSRVQHLDVSQGPLMRRYGLGQLAIYTAGTEYSEVSLAGLAFEQAQLLRDRLLPRDARADGV